VPPASHRADPDGPRAVPDFDRHLRRSVWIVALCVVAGAAVVYAGKAADERSAFIRWRPQILEFGRGVNIYDIRFFPNPPMMPLTLYPLMVLPPVAGALVWFGLKAALAALSAWACLRMVAPPGVSARAEVASWLRNTRNLARRVLTPSADIPPAEIPPHPIPSWVQATILVLSFRPILSDLHHGNNNLLILALVVASLAAWRRGYDVLAGLILALSITYKVTPGLFLAYYASRRSWRAVGATLLGMGIFLLIVPSLFLGPGFNGQCLGMWWHRIMSPYVTGDVAGFQEINQSMVGVVMRLLTAQEGEERYSVLLKNLHLMSLDPRAVVIGLKSASVAILVLLGLLCRTKASRRDDPRLLGEFSLVVLAMLFVSERSWKHHYVTVLLPYTYLTYRAFDPRISGRARAAIASALGLSALLMASTSSEVGGLLARGQGHKIAQFYGMFFWAGVVLFAATAWRVRVEGRSAPSAVPPHHVPAMHVRLDRAGRAEPATPG